MRRSIVQIIALAVLIVCGWYLMHLAFDSRRIRQASRNYESLYKATAVPSPTAAPSPSPAAETHAPTASPAPTAAATAAPTEAPLPDVSDVPHGTAQADTIVQTLPTAPPIQESFRRLLDVNEETVGFLEAEGFVALPVVQKLNDSSYYLDHGFEGEPAREGALFMDGANRLVPPDDCLIIYGHNMKNGEMFGRLSRIRQSSVSMDLPFRFDTIYEDGLYRPFAVLSFSSDPASAGHFDFRRPLFTGEDDFNDYLEELKAHALRWTDARIPYGTRLLLLVTCEYDSRDDRLIVALYQTDPEAA
ncbi:MAG: class B sortase [Clostridia bacterium]|nr:class B sortase [Clostridia bacterium]